MERQRLGDRVRTLRRDDAPERRLAFEEADVGVGRRDGQDPSAERQHAAIAKQRRRAARELERRPGVRGEIGRGLIATPVQDAEASLRINEAPAVEVHIVQNSEPPGGMGEAGTSAIVPAVTNAIFAATGKRLRKLPVDATALKQPV